MSHTHQLFTLVFLSLLLCARLHFSDFFSRATQRAPVLPPTRCKLPQKKGIYGGTGGLYVYVFLTAAALRLYMLCSPRCPDFCHVSRLYCPFSICFYCKLTYIYLYSGSALPHVYFIFILVFLIIRASILTHYYPHNIPHFSPFFNNISALFLCAHKIKKVCAASHRTGVLFQSFLWIFFR